MTKFNTRIIFILVIVMIIAVLIRLFPSEHYIKEVSLKSIEYANNFSWESYTGNEGSSLFSEEARTKYFGNSVDINYIKKHQEKSSGNIESFLEVIPKVPHPVAKFISYRKIEDINGTYEYKTIITYEFKFEDFHWLIDKVNFKRM